MCPRNFQSGPPDVIGCGPADSLVGITVVLRHAGLHVNSHQCKEILRRIGYLGALRLACRGDICFFLGRSVDEVVYDSRLNTCVCLRRALLLMVAIPPYLFFALESCIPKYFAVDTFLAHGHPFSFKVPFPCKGVCR